MTDSYRYEIRVMTDDPHDYPRPALAEAHSEYEAELLLNMYMHNNPNLNLYIARYLLAGEN